MGNPNGRKGAYWENSVVEYLRGHGYPRAERRTRQGRYDRGDIAGVEDVVIECKNEKAFDIPNWIAQAKREQETARAAFSVVMVKKRNARTRDGYAIMRIDDFIELLQEWHNGPAM